MTDQKETAAYYIDRIRAAGASDAFHSLIEAEDAVVPLLIEAFRAERDAGVRADLVEIIWQHRMPETVTFLSEALTDDVPEVWKSALDGLVTLGGADALGVLESARDRVASRGREGAVQTDWIEEAVQQIRGGGF